MGVFNKLHLRTFSLSSNLCKKTLPDEIKTKTKGVSSQHWLARQLSDPYVEKAKLLNYRCRSAFKLIEIDEKYKFLQPGHIAIDCGASPGSWTQVAVKKVNSDGSKKDFPQGKVIAIDRQLIYPIEGATIFGNMDFTNDMSQQKILECLGDEKPHAILSDMAPNATGIRALDNENIIHLCYVTLRFAVEVSQKDGTILVKLWQCGELKKLENSMSTFYENVKIVKPNSSRADSTEIFLLGRGFKGIKGS